MIKKLSDLLNVKEKISVNRQEIFELGNLEHILEPLDSVIVFIDKIKDKVKTDGLMVNYLNQLVTDINAIESYSSLEIKKDFLLATEREENHRYLLKKHVQGNFSKIKEQYDKFKFNLEFFDKIDYFSNSIVVLGANGSGKTFLSNKFKDYLPKKGVAISAQRILSIAHFNSIFDPLKTEAELLNTQLRDKSDKTSAASGYLQQEFSVILKNLLTQNIFKSVNYRKKALKSTSKELPIKKPIPTKLEIAFKIWNSLIEHRTIHCDDGINIKIKTNVGDSYSIKKMSDGEKVILYLIGHVLQAPSDGFIIVDEPEIHLHKTILKKLWDTLEVQRKDCIFIYLTHDLDFATSRTTAKKIWVKSFNYPDKWELEPILVDKIPENLLLELLGSRKNILFCEGSKGKTEEKVFQTLFPNFTIIPSGGCFNVINYTKAFNKLKNVNTKAFGLIDSDHHEITRLESFANDNIYSFTVAEIENLFMDLAFLKILAEDLCINEIELDKIKSKVIEELENLKKIQASNYVSTKVNHYFTDTHVSKGNSLDQLKTNYEKFKTEISINDWYEKRINELNKIISESDYNKVLEVFNYKKGFSKIANTYLRIQDFENRSITLLQTNKEARLALMKYFPEEIKIVGNIEINSEM